MPNIFLSELLTFSVTGNNEQLKDLDSAVEKNEHGIIVAYRENDIPCCFYIHPWHMVKGGLTVTRTGKEATVTFNGTAKIPVEKSTIDYAFKESGVFDIEGVRGDRMRLYIDDDVTRRISSPLKVSKSAPK
jgi:hypothetical protein